MPVKPGYFINRSALTGLGSISLKVSEASYLDTEFATTVTNIHARTG